ncbi:unnamed protein product [Bemisia tabaci]|uniref:Uncharacterized protein n=1 Tax=Bemisia tabaci TaxID=7038 RepID=A0A9P0F5R4_BEMTA|nr:unnamed protein product [Bemisia tabaci]
MDNTIDIAKLYKSVLENSTDPITDRELESHGINFEVGRAAYQTIFGKAELDKLEQKTVTRLGKSQLSSEATFRAAIGMTPKTIVPPSVIEWAASFNSQTLDSIQVDKKATGSVADLPRSGRPKFSEVEKNEQITAFIVTGKETEPYKEPGGFATTNKLGINKTYRKPKGERGVEDFYENITELSPININELKKMKTRSFRRRLRHIPTNPHILLETHTQYPRKLNVWCGIFGDHIIGRFFIDGTLHGDKYRELLEDAIDPRITEIVETDVTLLGDPIMFRVELPFPPRNHRRRDSSRS